MEDEEKKLIKKKVFTNVVKIIMDIILVLVLLLILWYCYSEIETFKQLNNDVCRLCEEKTGGTCTKDITTKNIKSDFVDIRLNESQIKELIDK